ncbi:MAG: hypothetical protein J0I09_03640 [Sphingobacteriia bacterium]|nr:hypothetical protein [Sphingobacteriia bacterium]
MARQKGILKLEGTIGNITFYKSADGYLAREKGGIDGNRIANDAAFQRTRENGAEFGAAGIAGKVLRTAFRSLTINAADRLMVSRLTREFVKVIQEDQTNTRGQRNVIDGEAALLQGFEFNEQGKLSTTMYAPYDVVIDRVAGTLVATIQPYVSDVMINAPSGATHYKIVAAGAEIDFENKTYVIDKKESAQLPWDSAATALLTLSCAVTAASTHPLFFALGIEFYQEVNGLKYPLKNGAFNSLCLVKVDTP